MRVDWRLQRDDVGEKGCCVACVSSIWNVEYNWDVCARTGSRT